MSTTTQWLSNIFAGVCVSAKMVNMKVSVTLISVNRNDQINFWRNKLSSLLWTICSNKKHLKMKSMTFKEWSPSA